MLTGQAIPNPKTQLDLSRNSHPDGHVLERGTITIPPGEIQSFDLVVTGPGTFPIGTHVLSCEYRLFPVGGYDTPVDDTRRVVLPPVTVAVFE